MNNEINRTQVMQEIWNAACDACAERAKVIKTDYRPQGLYMLSGDRYVSVDKQSILNNKFEV